MKLLGIDTATLTAGIAVADDDRVLAEVRHDSASRSADLLVAIDEVCRRAGVAPRDLDAIAIGAGPGSFTGLRIGMATAKGIAFAAQRPLWAVSSLAALAWDGHAALHGATAAAISASPTAVVCAVLDARRSEVYAGCYRGSVALNPERVMAPAELLAWATELAAGTPVWFAGDALARYPGPLAACAASWLAPRTPSGSAVAALARAGAHADITTSGAPTYIRPSEAEVKYPDGVPGALRRSEHK